MQSVVVSTSMSPSGLAERVPAIAVKGAVKRYGHVQALRGASLEVYPGEIVALYGDNGAGKSTLMKVMLGVVPPDSGSISIAGREVDMTSIRESQDRGVDAVHQDLALPPDLTVLESMFLGHEVMRTGLLGRLGVLDRAAMADASREALERLGIRLTTVRVPVKSLSGGQRQAVAVARAVMWTSTALLMDEPTAALGVAEGRPDGGARRPPERHRLRHDRLYRRARTRRARHLTRPTSHARDR